jgi:hypothetical protein
MRAYFKAAEQRARAGDDLAGMPVASLTLYLEAALYYMAALLSVRTDARLADPLRGDDLLALFRELDKGAPPPCTDDELAEFFRLLTKPDPLWLDRQPRRSVARKLRSIRSIVFWLRGLNEPRSRFHILALRAARVGALVLLAVSTVTWGAAAALRRKNIALYKPVMTSSVHPWALSQPSGLTDGVIAGAYGAHTNYEAAPWVEVDLSDVYRIDEIDIYNRGDGWFDEGLPMMLLLSENGDDFVLVETRTQTFGQSSPWTYLGHGHRARYIRVKGAPGKFVALSELEAFGKK